MNRIANHVLATALLAGTAQAAPLLSTNATTTYHRVQVDGVEIFYRSGQQVERSSLATGVAGATATSSKVYL